MPREDIFTKPQHGYTQPAARRRAEGRSARRQRRGPVVVETDDLKVWFPIKKGALRRTVDYVKAVDGLSLKLRKGQTLGVVGESGSGKTTLGLAILRLISSQGPIAYIGKRIDGLTDREMRPLRKEMQIVFQDPYGSLSPRMSVSQIIEEGLTDPGARARLRPAPRAHQRRAEGGRPRSDARRTAIRTSSPAASASASPLPAPWCCSRSS